MRDAPVEHAGDGGGVGKYQRNELEGDDGVEGDGGADVDQCEQTRDDAGEGDGVGGYVSTGVGRVSAVGRLSLGSVVIPHCICIVCCHFWRLPSKRTEIWEIVILDEVMQAFQTQICPHRYLFLALLLSSKMLDPYSDGYRLRVVLVCDVRETGRDGFNLCELYHDGYTRVTG
jgi:hypothetical protein